MSQRLTFLISVSCLAIGVSAVSIAQSGGSDKDPYAAYYSHQNSGSSDQMQGGPLAKPMPANVKRDMSGGPMAAPPPRGTAPRPTGSNSGGSSYAAPAQYGGSKGTYTPQAGGRYTPPAPQAAPQTLPPLAGPSSAASIQYGGVSKPSDPIYGRSQGGTQQNPQFQRGPSTQNPQYQGQYQNGQYGAQVPYPHHASGPNAPRQPQAKQRWWQKLGFGNVEMKTDGYARLGDAGVLRGDDDTTNELAADAMIRTEVSAITQGGIEYGVSLKLRGQRDRYRRGFGGATNVFGAAECLPGFADCNSVLLNGVNRAVKGHTGQLYNATAHDMKEHEFALEGAHIFLRTAYGDVTLGRDDGAAALFSIDAPSTLPLARSSNSKVDYTGLDMTKTVNDASGFAEKITYTSPRMLGDQIGVGVQFGASYALSTEVCGVDYCVRGNDRANVNSPLSPSLEDAIELGVSLDRTFDNGMGFEAVANYATASETSGIAGFDDLSSWGLGLNLTYGDFIFGTSYLNSNNGWDGDGTYSAYDVGLTWKPSTWGLTASYGQSTDDLAQAEGRSALLGVSYDFTDSFTVGTGVQYTDRDIPVLVGGTRESISQDATALFIEGGIKF